MDLVLVQDLVVPPIEQWPSDALGDPLHPAHGPLPDLAQIRRCGDYLFKTALWSRGGIYVMLELIWEESDLAAPLLPINTVYAVRGWIAHTYYWQVDGNGVSCLDVRVPYPQHPDEDTWRRSLYQDVLRETVRLAMQGK